MIFIQIGQKHLHFEHILTKLYRVAVELVYAADRRSHDMSSLYSAARSLDYRMPWRDMLQQEGKNSLPSFYVKHESRCFWAGELMDAVVYGPAHRKTPVV